MSDQITDKDLETWEAKANPDRWAGAAILRLVAEVRRLRKDLAEEEEEREHYVHQTFVDAGANPPVAWKDVAKAAQAKIEEQRKDIGVLKIMLSDWHKVAAVLGKTVQDGDYSLELKVTAAKMLEVSERLFGERAGEQASEVETLRAEIEEQAKEIDRLRGEVADRETRLERIYGHECRP